MKQVICCGLVALWACGDNSDTTTRGMTEGLDVAPAPIEGVHPRNRVAPPDARRTDVPRELATLAAQAIISNGTVQLGINSDGSLNVPGGTLSTGSNGTTYVGLRYLPTGGESTAPGCLCEGWGVADGAVGITGWTDQDIGTYNITVESFTATATEATSVVRIGSDFRVTHHFAPSAATPYLYEVKVTIENISGDVLEDVRYTRAMDWDISPNTFSEYVTIQGTSGALNVRYADNNGFANPDPLRSRFSLGASGDFIDYGPQDHGALFDFVFGSLERGKTREFTIFYGGAPTESAALAALGSVRAEVYSFGQSNWDGTGDYKSPGGAPTGTFGKTTGEPHTFIFAFAGVGGTPPVNAPPVAEAGPDVTLACLPPGASAAVNLDGTASHDPEGAPLTFSWTLGSAVLSTAPAPTVSLPVGTHTISLVVSDGTSSSEPDSLTATLIADTAPPSIALNGASSMSLECGRDTYSELGARASDVCSGDLTSSIIRSGSVNTGTPGSYAVSYSVTDAAGLQASTTRTVAVSDTTPPLITLNGASSMTLECGRDTYSEPGAQASDVCWGDLTSAIVISGSVDVGTPGAYFISYSVVDGAGLTDLEARTVSVVDTTPPVLTPVPDVQMWPPNHQMQSFNLSDCAAVVDSCTGATSINGLGVISSISSDEPEDADGVGDGQTSGDIVITGSSSFQLRAERDGRGNGRVYGVNYSVTDAAGNVTKATCYISVPHDMSGAAARDDGAESGYTVTR
ncbi:MAG TPA: immunoglobulin-like domain-containing protein [Myxococcales bacterium]|nr:immunoglobulin-like domain-containing protein [Myxococcales bacterium]